MIVKKKKNKGPNALGTIVQGVGEDKNALIYEVKVKIGFTLFNRIL